MFNDDYCCCHSYYCRWLCKPILEPQILPDLGQKIRKTSSWERKSASEWCFHQSFLNLGPVVSFSMSSGLMLHFFSVTFSWSLLHILCPPDLLFKARGFLFSTCYGRWYPCLQMTWPTQQSCLWPKVASKGCSGYAFKESTLGDIILPVKAKNIPKALTVKHFKMCEVCLSSNVFFTAEEIQDNGDWRVLPCE